MENQPLFNKAELKDFAKFWEGEIGSKFLAELEKARDGWLAMTMQAKTPDQAYAYANVASGIAGVIADIYVTIDTAKEDEKEATGKDK